MDVNPLETATFPKLVSVSPLKPSEQQALLDIQLSILKMVANNLPAQDIFTKLCLMAEALLPKSVASIMLKQPAGHMDVICAPSVPPEAQAMLNGVVPSATAGSCGNAVFNNKPTFVFNALTDNRCLDTADVFQKFGLHACWSTPITSAEGNAIGSFALSSFDLREPTSFHKDLLAIGSYIIGIILERSEQQAKLEFMAFSDPLTGLANRANLFQQLQETINSAQTNGDTFGVIYIDLDRFKNLNDTFGHTFGDSILKIIAKRLKNCSQEADCIARVGGDEFAVLVKTAAHTETVSQQIINVLCKPITYHTHRFQLGCTLGIAFFPQDGDNTSTLLKNADTAMYNAKNNGAKIRYYDPSFSERSKREFTIENQLHEALKRQEFELYYQSQVDTNSHKITGYEALIRWRTADNKLISPTEFIPIAEQTGLIVPIGEWVVETALNQAAALLAQTNHPIQLSINLSGAQLIESHIDRLLELVNNSRFPNDAIYFEITETVLIEEGGKASELLDKICAAGIKLAIDDFGIGYSSLAYLKRFNISQLKIDRMLISDIDTNDEDLAISRAAIALGKSLDLEVIAEGIETLSQARTLQVLSCDKLQGFYFSRPQPFKNLLEQ